MTHRMEPPHTIEDVDTVVLAWAERQRIKARMSAETNATDTASSPNGVSLYEIDEDQPTALTMNEAVVLKTISEFDLAEDVPAARTETEIKPAARLSARTINPIVHHLIERKLAECPQGKRSGGRLTITGGALRGRLPIHCRYIAASLPLSFRAVPEDRGIEKSSYPIKPVSLNVAARCLRTPARWLREEIHAGRLPALIEGNAILVHGQRLLL